MVVLKRLWIPYNAADTLNNNQTVCELNCIKHSNTGLVILLLCCFFLFLFFPSFAHPSIITHILYWMESQSTDFMQCCIVPYLWEATLLVTGGSCWVEVTAEFWLVQRTEAEDKKRSKQTVFVPYSMLWPQCSLFNGKRVFTWRWCEHPV